MNREEELNGYGELIQLNTDIQSVINLTKMTKITKTDPTKRFALCSIKTPRELRTTTC